MNFKLFGLLIVFCMVVAPFSVAASDGSKYVDYNPVLSLPKVDTYGYVIAYVRAGGSAQDLTIWIKNNLQKNVTFDSAFHMDRTVIDGQNPDFLKLKILPDGISEPLLLASGNYTAYLQNGNSNQLEVVNFIIGGKDITRITFLGAAVSPKHRVVPYKVYKIINASWGASGKVCDFMWIDETNHTVYHPEVNHTQWIDETNHTVYHPEVNHTEYRIVKIDCSGRYCKVIYGEWQLTNPCNDNFKFDSCIIGCKYETRIVIDQESWNEVVVDTPGHYELIVDQEGWTEIVIDVPAHAEEICRDISSTIMVTSEVQNVVDRGYKQFMFNTGPNDNPDNVGIFTIDGTKLIGLIDPLPGVPKNIHIEYFDLYGNIHVINTYENVLINL